MLMIRLQRIGRRNDAAYRIAVLEKARAARTGRVVEALGSYNPKTKAFNVDETRAKGWIAQGAQPTDTLKNLFITKGLMEGKKADVFPSSARKKAREAAQAAAAEAQKAAEADAAAKKAEAEAAAAASAEVPSESEVQEVEAAPAAEMPSESEVQEAPAAPEAAPQTPTEEPAPAEAAPEDPAA